METILLIGSALIIISVVLSKFSEKLGVPILLLFLGIGMFAGSEGPGGIYFSDPNLARSVGIIALVFILFAAGLDTKWNQVRPVLKEAAALATLGVILTAVSVGLFAVWVLKFSLLEGLLFGAIISSTDAAAVFSVLRSKNLSLKNRIRPLLELESGSNDPMAVFLTITLIQAVLTPSQGSTIRVLTFFLLQMGIGAALGFLSGKLLVTLLNRARLAYEGIYPVFSLAFACLIYAATSLFGGSGFLAIYIAGIIIGNSEVVHKKSLLHFFDGLAWLSQISMFLTLGLFVFPSQITPVLGAGVLVSIFLIFAARPLSVFIPLAFSDFNWREKAFVAWGGLRGAVPIILATFPLIAGVPKSGLMFHLVFCIVLVSTLLQGWSMPAVARFLKVDAPAEANRAKPIEFAPVEGTDTSMMDFIVPFGSPAAGHPIGEIGMPKDTLIMLIIRNDQFIVPSGTTALEEGDVIQVLGNKWGLKDFQKILTQKPDPSELT